MNYPNLLIVLAATLAATAALVPFARVLGRRLDATDHPDGLSHDHHQVVVPRTGGIAMILGAQLGLLLWMVLSRAAPDRFELAVAASVVTVAVGGLLDDINEINPLYKFAFLAGGALAVLLVAPYLPVTRLERLDMVIALVAMVGLANAVNFVDGMDGLAAGMCLVTLAGFAVLGWRRGDEFLIAKAGVWAAACLAFLLYNRPPARIFMGDCGSLVLGVVLAALGLKACGHGVNHVIAVILFLSPYALDMTLAVARRLYFRQDILSGDRRHCYDLLFRRLKSVWLVDLAMCGLALTGVGMGFAALHIDLWTGIGLVAVAWAAFALWMIRLGMFAPIENESEEQKGLFYTKTQRHKDTIF